MVSKLFCRCPFRFRTKENPEDRVVYEPFVVTMALVNATGEVKVLIDALPYIDSE